MNVIVKVNHCFLLYGAWLVCFLINATFEIESDLYHLSYIT